MKSVLELNFSMMKNKQKSNKYTDLSKSWKVCLPVPILHEMKWSLIHLPLPDYSFILRCAWNVMKADDVSACMEVNDGPDGGVKCQGKPG